MFDTHCHLNFDVFDKNLDDVVNSARENNVKSFIAPGTNLENSKLAIEIANHYSGVHAAVGIHPTEDLESFNKNKLLYKLNKLSEEKKVVAIGEIGLDYYKYKAPSRVQKDFLKEQIKIAIKNDLTIILHNRQAAKDIIDVVDSLWSKGLERRIVFHCVEPDKILLNFCIKKKIYMGIDGDVTYDSKKQEFVKEIPLGLMVLETDSPFLMPEPARNDTRFPNEPKNLKFVLQKIAELKSIDEGKLEKTTTQNAKRLFALD